MRLLIIFIVGKILNESDADIQQKLAKQAADLALLSVGLLKGKDLTELLIDLLRLLSKIIHFFDKRVGGKSALFLFTQF